MRDTNLTDAETFQGPPSAEWEPGAPQAGVLEIERTDSGRVRATVNGDRPVRHSLVYHSPTGFEYGYLGSGPADLALNILALFVDPPTAWQLHQPFKEQHVAPLDGDRDHHSLDIQKIRDWIQRELERCGRVR